MKLSLRDPPPEHGDDVAPGQCWYARRGSDGRWQWKGTTDAWPLTLAVAHKDVAQPMVVVLPNGMLFCLHQGASRDGSGWTVAGELPNVTVSPSIDAGVGRPSRWHGWLRNGELVDA